MGARSKLVIEKDKNGQICVDNIIGFRGGGGMDNRKPSSGGSRLGKSKPSSGGSRLGNSKPSSGGICPWNSKHSTLRLHTGDTRTTH